MNRKNKLLLRVSKLNFHGLTDARNVTVDNSNMMLSTCKLLYRVSLLEFLEMKA